MSTTDGPPRGRLPAWRRPLMAAAAGAAAAAVIAAWIDWTWWSPVYGVQVVAILAVALAVPIAWLLRRRLPGILGVALGAVAGLALGFALGPSREQPQPSEGVITVRLTRPAAMAEETVRAECSSVSSGEHVRVSARSPTEMPDGRVLLLSVSIGDMWSMNRDARGDHLAVDGIIQQAPNTPVGDAPEETRVAATDGSRLTVEGDGFTGSMTFDGLVSYADGAPEVTEPIDLAGTVAWRCEPPVQEGARG